MRTKDVAAAAAVNSQTLRYYERLGLLAQPIRTPGGYRIYPPDVVGRIRFIKQAQQLGLSLAEVQLFLNLADGTDATDETRALVKEKLMDLQRRIVDLQMFRADLLRLVAAFDDREQTPGA